MIDFFDRLPSWVRISTDVTAALTAVSAFLSAAATPLAALASLAALIYTVMRIVQLRREMKGKRP